MSTQASAALVASNLSKTYVLGFLRKKIRAVRDVSLRVERGEIFGLLGPNGAGKTTTLKMLFGLVRPCGGRAEVLGRPVNDVRAKRHVGYLPESPYFYDYLSGRELLTFAGQLFDLSRRESRKRADRLLERVGLGDAADRALRRYSKGMLQRVGIAQALINEPDLVVLDEPLTGLDPIGRKQLRELIASLRHEGKTVVLSTHILSDIELLADRVAIVVAGRTVSGGRPEELINASTLSTEVLFSGGDEALATALEQTGHPLLQRGDTVRVTLAGEAPADPLIDLIRKHGGRIVAVTPRKESLEDVVIRQAELGGSAAADGSSGVGDADAAQAQEAPQQDQASAG